MLLVNGIHEKQLQQNSFGGVPDYKQNKIKKR